jgi:hypothetical protein
MAVAGGGARTVSTCGSSGKRPTTGEAAVLRTGAAPIDSVPPDGACAASAPVGGRLPLLVPWSARRISVAVENLISGRAAIA